jgi:hypothetical protein
MVDQSAIHLPPDATQWQRIRAFVSRNIAVLFTAMGLAVSIASLGVATRAVMLAETIQERDREYKELGMRPKLSFGTSSIFTWRIKNSGLGPAVIKRWAMRFDDKCITTDRFTLPVMTEMHDQTANRLLHTAFAALDLPQQPTHYSHTVGLLAQGFHIDRGEEYSLFRLAPEALAAIQQRIGSMGGEEQRQAMVRFYALAISMPIALTYCSVSGVFCETIGSPEICKE